MISTVSLSFDLTYTDPITGTVIPRCVVTDSTDYASIADFDLVLQQAKGYGVLTFNGDVIDSKNSVGDPLIDLQNWNFLDGTPTGYFDLPLDLNGNVANGVYGLTYSLRLTEGAPDPTGSIFANTFTLTGYEWMSDFFQVGNSISFAATGGGAKFSRNILSISYSSGSTIIGFDGAVVTTGSYDMSYNVTALQYTASYSYAGCTQVSADVNFNYDCEYGDFGTWSVSNTTNLASGEIVSSLNCTVNYPSWTATPPVVITSLPYPTTPSLTPLATGTYTVVLSQQIQQTQVSGLVVLYNNSVIKEFAVTCAGTLCGLVPCIENLRAAHATELIRNRISKYQVFVDNVALYYIEAMNYRACGELDKYRETLTLLQAQLDASGCECSCCDDNTYYWVSNNSATSVIDELLANIQYRLYDGNGDDPGALQTSVEFGAIWQDVSTGILYRCTVATPGELEWEVYYNPAGTIQAIDVIATPNSPLTAGTVQGQLNEIAADFIYDGANGINKTGTNLELGGALNQNTTIDLGFRTLDFTSTSGNLEFASTIGGNMVVSTSAGTAIDVTGTSSALKVEGTVNSLDVTATNTTAGILKVQRTVDDTVAVNLALQTGVDSAAGANGLGSSIQFASEGSTSSIVTTGSIQSVLTSASAPTEGNLKFNTKSASGLINSFTLNPDGSATLPLYGDGTFAGSPEYYLGVDVDGNVIESNPVSNASNGLSISGSDVVLGGSLDGNTTIDLNTRNLTLSGTTGNLILSATSGTALDVSSGTSSAITVNASSNAIIATSTSDVAAILAVNKNTNNSVSRNVILRTNVDGFPGGAAGLGSSIVFQGENIAGTTFDMAEIKTTMTNAASGVSKFDFTLKDLRGSSLVPAMTINGDFSLNLSEYGSGTFTGTATRSLSVDASGNVIETPLSSGGPLVYVARITQTGLTPPTATVIANTTGATFTWGYTAAGIYSVTASSPVLTTDKTAIYVTPSSSRAYIMMANVGSTTQCSVTSSNDFGLSGYTDGYINGATVKIEIYS